MTLSKLVRSAAALGSLLCVGAIAQTRYCTGGDLSRLTPAERSSCESKLQGVREVATALHAPSDWHFVVVCGEEGWRSYAAFSSGSTVDLADANADTNLQTRETFLRGTRLQDQGDGSFRHIVAREIAGILLNSKDAIAIEQEAGILLARNQGHAGV